MASETVHGLTGRVSVGEIRKVVWDYDVMSTSGQIQIAETLHTWARKHCGLEDMDLPVET